MISSYFSQAWRAIAHNRRYMIISMVGLVLSLAGAIIIARYLHRELTVNHYIPELNRTMVGYMLHDGHKVRTSMIDFMKGSEYFQPNEDKDIEKSTQFYTYDNSYVTAGDSEMPMDIILADTAYFDILPRVLLEGKFPSKEFEAVVTSDAARRLWPDKNPIGETLAMHSDHNIYTVVGVVGQMPTKGHFDFDVMLCRDIVHYYSRYTGWIVSRLRPMASVDSVNARFIRSYDAMPEGEAKMYIPNTRYMPLADLYFDTSFHRLSDDPLNPLGNKHNLHILEIVAWLLLLIGLFNFLNIYSIVMITRSPDFAVRKVFGANRISIFMHILVENLLVIGIAVVLAWIIIGVASPLLSNYFGIEQMSSTKFDLLLSISIVVVFALVVSAVSAASIWRKSRVHSMGNADSRHAIVIRRYLLLMPQMALTLIMITLSVYFMRQLHYMLYADMGFARENILCFNLWPEQGRDKAYPVFTSDYSFDDMKKENERRAETVDIALGKIREMPEVIASSRWASEDLPSLMYLKGNTMQMHNADAPDSKPVSANILYLSKDAMDVFQINVSEGQSFAKYDSDQDSYGLYEMLASRNLLDKLGITDYHTGKVQMENRLWYSMDYDTSTNPPYDVIGVIDNLRINPMSEEDLPATIHFTQGDNLGKPIVRYNPDQKESLLAKLTALYQELNGKDIEPEFEFSEEVNEQIYGKEKLTAQFYAVFAALAIFISCLGLYGVMAYDMQRRRREFMIRRVQGATSRHLVKLTARPYAVTLGIAAIIAAAASVYAVVQYQSHYYDHVSMQPWGFIAGVALIAIMGYATIKHQISKTLRQEYSHD